MKVSIVILNYNNPQIIDICLDSLTKTDYPDGYEVIVVDNGSQPDLSAHLKQKQAQGLIDTLVLEPVNHMFSGGNNIGVAHSNPESEYILLLNSDVAIMRPDWLTKQVGWMEGTTQYEPSVWGTHPTKVRGGPFDIVSIGWSHDASVEPSHCRPEGWCCMIRRSVWTDISEDFPWHYGMEEMLANAVRNGARCGVLSQYGHYVIHREGASGKKHMTHVVNTRVPDMAGWFAGLNIETLDFTLGPHEHSSYMVW